MAKKGKACILRLKMMVQDKWTKDLWGLMLPMIASNILQQLYNTIDSLIISRYTDESSFAAVGISSSVMNLFLFLLVGACTGISVLFSQSFGKGDTRELREYFYQSSVLGTVLAAALGVLGIISLPLILTFIQVPISLMPLVRSYLIVILVGLPASFIYNICSALLRSVGHTFAVMAVLIVCVAANTGLDIFMVKGLGLGLFGV